jgi:hypothetical protein
MPFLKRGQGEVGARFDYGKVWVGAGMWVGPAATREDERTEGRRAGREGDNDLPTWRDRIGSVGSAVGRAVLLGSV